MSKFLLLRKRAAADVNEEPSKKIKPSSNLEQKVPLSSTESLIPKISLGKDVYLYVNYFLGHTRIHVRKFARDAYGEVYPTKDGVSLSLEVWIAFLEKIGEFASTSHRDDVMVMLKDLCVSKTLLDGNMYISMQRLFQRKDTSFGFVPEFIALEKKWVGTFFVYEDLIMDNFKQSLVENTFVYFVKRILKNKRESGELPQQTHEQCWDPDNPEEMDILMNSLCKCLFISLNEKINKMINCNGCIENSSCELNHECLSYDAKDVYKELSNKALSKINWEELANSFIDQNLYINNFVQMIIVEDFSDNLNYKTIFETVEDMFVKSFPAYKCD